MSQYTFGGSTIGWSPIDEWLKERGLARGRRAFEQPASATAAPPEQNPQADLVLPWNDGPTVWGFIAEQREAENGEH